MRMHRRVREWLRCGLVVVVTLSALPGARAQSGQDANRELGEPTASAVEDEASSSRGPCLCAAPLVSEQPLLDRRLRRLRVARFLGITLLTGGTLMGVLSVAARNPFAWGMTGVGMVSASLLLLAPLGGLYRSLLVERGELDAGRWDTMRRMRRRGGWALVTAGMLALLGTVPTQDSFLILLVGLPLGLPLAFAGSHLLLSSMDARPTRRARPVVQASVDPRARGASVHVSLTY